MINKRKNKIQNNVLHYFKIINKTKLNDYDTKLKRKKGKIHMTEREKQ